MSVFVYYFFLLLLVFFFSRLVSRWLVRLLGWRSYVALFFPGVVMHEAAHMLAAFLTFTRIVGFSFLPRRDGDGKIILGSVVHAAVKNPLKMIIISSFPLFVGVLSLYGLTLFFVPSLFSFAMLDGWAVNLGDLPADIWDFMKFFVASFNMASWRNWLFVYLAVSVSAHLAPSARDLRHALGGIFALGLFSALVFYAVGQDGLRFLSSSAADFAVGFFYAAGHILLFVLLLLFLLAVILGGFLILKRFLRSNF